MCDLETLHGEKMAKNKKIITELSDKILRDWFGPTGECWCETKQKFVDPDTCKDPACETLRSQDTRQFRYLHLHDDYKTMGINEIIEKIAFNLMFQSTYSQYL